MKLHVVRYLALIAMFALFSQHVVAQEDEEDYRQYKFYKEDDDVLEVMAQEVDSLSIYAQSTAWSRYQAVSGMMIPPIVFSSAGAGRISTLSANGLIFIVYLIFLLLISKSFNV